MAGLQKFRALIGGQSVESASGEWFESFNPYTGQPWALIPRCGRADAHLGRRPVGQQIDPGDRDAAAFDGTQGMHRGDA